MTERIGRYELVKALAEGDRGKLYLARAPGYGGFARHVVIKTFEQLPGAAEGSFLEETSDLGRLHHQHITPVLDVGRDGDRFFVALDFVHGRSAREVWQQTFTIGAVLPLDFALSVVVAIASGLHHAHTRRPVGLVHGHVSLSNILIGFDGTLQLAGFVGASVRGLRATDTQLGFAKDQLAYLAPEQARRAGPIDPRSDVFALGTILYELTTMTRAFRDDSDRLTIERVKAASYRKPRAFLPDYPPELELIIARALELDPTARYPNAEMLRRELLAVGHRLELVLGDPAIVDVMAQLFEDSAVDPWTSNYTAARDAADPPTDPGTAHRKLRAATESVDALAIELEIPLSSSGRALPLPPPRDATTSNEAAADSRDATPSNEAAADDARATNPLGTPHNEVAADDARATNPLGTPNAPVSNDTDGVPVLVPLPHAGRAATSVVQPGARRRPIALVIAAAVAVVAVTTVVALALRGNDGGTPPPIDAAPAAVVVIDAAPIDAASDAAIDAPPDASMTVRIQITSTPSNGTVLLDGKKLGKTPFDGVVDRAAGKHVIKVRLANHTTGRIEVELTGDVQAALELKPAQE